MRGGRSGGGRKGGRRGGRGRQGLRVLEGGRRRPVRLRVGGQPPAVAADTPCPCGSSAPFGKCCGRDVRRRTREIRDWARSWHSVAHKVRTFALELLGGPPAVAAWEDLLDLVPPGEVDPAALEKHLGPALATWLASWSLFWWIPWDEAEGREKLGWRRPTLAEEFAARHGAELGERERAYLAAATGCPFSFHQVTGRAPGLLFTRDLLLGERHVLVDPDLPRYMLDGMILYGAIGSLPFGSALLGNGPAAIAIGDDLGPVVRQAFRARGRQLDRANLRLEWRPPAIAHLATLAQVVGAAGPGIAAATEAGGARWN